MYRNALDGHSQDVRVKRGADAVSDHHLLIGNLKLKVKKSFTSGTATTQIEKMGKRETWRPDEQDQLCQRPVSEHSPIHPQWLHQLICAVLLLVKLLYCKVSI